MTDAPDALRCTAKLGAIQCSLEHHAGTGHVYVSGSYVPDRHEGN
jgi:hypothetical protein